MIAIKFCAWHDSLAVVSCTKCCRNPITRNGNTAKIIFPLNLNFEWKTISRMDPWASCCWRLIEILGLIFLPTYSLHVLCTAKHGILELRLIILKLNSSNHVNRRSYFLASKSGIVRCFLKFLANHATWRIGRRWHRKLVACVSLAVWIKT